MTLLKGENISLSLSQRVILDSVDICLKPGEMLGLIGPNGSGKSSLLKLLAGLIEPHQGSLFLGDDNLTSLSLQQRAQRIAWLPQQGEANWPMTVETLISLGRTPRLSPWEQITDQDLAIVDMVIEETDLQHLRKRPCNRLSGGELSRVLLARALAIQADILLLDEPVAALDLAHQLDVMSLLKNYCTQVRGVIVVLHDLSLAARFCDRLVLLYNGRVLAVGDNRYVLSRKNLALAYQVRPPDDSTGPLCPSHWQRIP